MCLERMTPWCTVGTKARRKSLPRLIMTLFTSVSHRALFSPLLSHSMRWCAFSFFLFHSLFIFYVQHTTKVWPALSFLQFLTITAGLSPDKSNEPACLPESVQLCGSIGITVNTLSCFCWVVECLLLMVTPVFFAKGRLCSPWDGGSIAGCSKWSESLSTKSIGF